MARSLLITGTDTGVGKTTVASGIAAALRRRGCDVSVVKPVETGCKPGEDGSLDAADARQLRWAAGRGDSLDRICPYRFRDPLAPSVAAQREGVQISLSQLIRHIEAASAAADVALVEGAGGLLVPITNTATFADLARACELSVLVVVGNRLGAINHARLTLDWARNAQLDIAGYVVNTLQNEGDLAAETNIDVLRSLCGPSLGVMPFVGCIEQTDSERDRLAAITEDALDLDALLRVK